ncbi:hypothetical protein [Embleya sp. NPDC001921]
MSGAGKWFTDRKQALAAIDAVTGASVEQTAGSAPRVLLLTGVSGTGKSTLLERTATRCPHVLGGVLDIDALVARMAESESGADAAALELLRQVGDRLAGAAPWWSRRWARRRARAIGTVPSVRQHASVKVARGGSVAHSPQILHPPQATQPERRTGWQEQLDAVARPARRRRCVLLLDTCERLAYFDDTHPTAGGDPYGLGGWFTSVLAGLLTRMPKLSVVLAAAHRAPVTLTPATPDTLAPPTVGGHPCTVHELRRWTPADTRRYLERRGVTDPAWARAAVEAGQGGLPVEAAWLADLLTTDAVTTTPDADARAAADLTRMPRDAWAATHVLPRLARAHKALLPAAVILRTFTPGGLRTVAEAGPDPHELPAWDDDWFRRFSALSAVSPVPGTDRWRLHRTVRDWLLDAYTRKDADRVPADRLLPHLHRAAADYHHAMTPGVFSPDEARHRLALGEFVPAWTTQLAEALTAPPDPARVRLLTDLALDPEARDTLGEHQPAHLADAHLARAWLHHQSDQHTDAQDHAEHALDHYRAADPRHPALAAAARLAGQSAWKRHRFAHAAAHWHTALATGADPPPADLIRARAEAVLRTGIMVSTMLSESGGSLNS